MINPNAWGPAAGLFCLAAGLTWMGQVYRRTKAPRGTPITRDPYGTTGRWLYLPIFVLAALTFVAAIAILFVQ